MTENSRLGQIMLKIDKNECRELMLRMMKVRTFEEEVRRLYYEGAVHGTLHLCVGQEAADIGSTAVLKKEDFVFPTHRGHGVCIGKGTDMKKMMAEILGRRTGTNLGRGGSMHICDAENGIIGSNGVVGANAPIACGAALTIRQKKQEDRVSVCFTGDGAANSGAVLESMNLAGLWKLPVIFVLMENHYAVSTLVENASANPDFTKRAEIFNLNCFETDGNDILAVRDIMRQARQKVLEDRRPCLVVEHTYRISGHSKSDANKYRTAEEIRYWEERGPIIRFSEKLISEGMFIRQEIDEILAEARTAVGEAVDFALQSPAADDTAAMLTSSVYAD